MHTETLLVAGYEVTMWQSGCTGWFAVAYPVGRRPFDEISVKGCFDTLAALIAYVEAHLPAAIESGRTCI